MMERLLSPHSAEARAHLHATENGIDADHESTRPQIDERILAYTAAYTGLERYLSGEHLFIVPRTRPQLESILRRYSTDAIHNAIAKSRSTLNEGGYSRVITLAVESIRAVLNAGDNEAYLLGLHSPQSSPTTQDGPP
ncbi:hypothetical protein MIND_00735200 [Mycena indigotica]|uniref:Uncharacterized protein n=1 Tax=Mycena indigotica TaxID=2126181 RepID=A0A8H6W1M0_9AGAR|nr:uncharacterized protein MIND_00735200 [Mycena indigotica]KAF7301697.1 hypothetical protein MIND_00735200 [Mycena indigotica]